MAVIRKTMLAALAGTALLTAAPANAADGTSDISRFMLDNGGTHLGWHNRPQGLHRILIQAPPPPRK